MFNTGISPEVAGILERQEKFENSWKTTIVPTDKRYIEAGERRMSKAQENALEDLKSLAKLRGNLEQLEKLNKQIAVAAFSYGAVVGFLVASVIVLALVIIT